MTQPPRLPRANSAERLRTIARQYAPGSSMGGNRQARLINRSGTGGGRQASLLDAAPFIAGRGAASTGTGIGPVVVGLDALSTADNTLTAGHSAETDGDGGVALGWLAHSTDVDGTALGAASTAGLHGTALGASTYAAAAGSVAIGMDDAGNPAIAASANDFILGVAAHNVKVAGKFAVNGATPQAKAATPTTLADVIAILQAYGLCT